MAIEQVKRYLAEHGFEDRVMEFATSSATVELAAEAVGVSPARIAKTLSFKRGEGCMLIVLAGDTRIDNAKFKARFGMKAAMLRPDEVAALLGQTVGGVCPFAVDSSVPVYLDEAMKRFDTVFPACGSANSAIELDCASLFRLAQATDWVDVSKPCAIVL